MQVLKRIKRLAQPCSAFNQTNAMAAGAKKSMRGCMGVEGRRASAEERRTQGRVAGRLKATSAGRRWHGVVVGSATGLAAGSGRGRRC